MACQPIYASLEHLNDMRHDLDKLLNQPAIREATENHKSNWIPDSKGGEPNCKRGCDV